VLQRAREKLTGARSFYGQSEGEPVRGQNPVYAFYIDHKISYPLAFRQSEKDECEDQEEAKKTKYDLARELITELEEEVGVPVVTYLFDSWLAHDSGLIAHVESYGLGRVTSEQPTGRVRK